eukprot:CAMPEP_0194666350 /NCGR_PEP_ID=MMETSP0295-20121207/2669_1 /TAXON_ID=39354 /ORGANISM="Heterosigma akashiwo, Strain CCMP2393" /LENGTH=91 /DNA_ID=CAMNT_0039548595 /DNA_START=125 /DNA_END=401 /DNA_ORIENTATION=+
MIQRYGGANAVAAEGAEESHQKKPKSLVLQKAQVVGHGGRMTVVRESPEELEPSRGVSQLKRRATLAQGHPVQRVSSTDSAFKGPHQSQLT